MYNKIEEELKTNIGSEIFIQCLQNNEYCLIFWDRDLSWFTAIPFLRAGAIHIIPAYTQIKDKYPFPLVISPDLASGFKELEDRIGKWSLLDPEEKKEAIQYANDIIGDAHTTKAMEPSIFGRPGAGHGYTPKNRKLL